MICVDVADLFRKTAPCDLAELMKRASLRDDQGNNYVIVTPPGSQRSPIMVVYFKDDHAVVTYIKDEESGIQLLTSDSSFDREDEIEFLSPFEGCDTFTSDFIVSSSTAAKFLEAFATGMPWPPLPFWEEL
jgi:hypothetical protein